MANVLVTGGAGFIGSHLVDALVEAGHYVVVLDDLSTGKRENINHQAIFLEYSIQKCVLEHIFDAYKFDYVFHLAAHIDLRKSFKRPVYDCEHNVLSTVRILDAIQNYPVKKLVYFSTGAVYNPEESVPWHEWKSNDSDPWEGIDSPIGPESPYGLSKYCAEQYIELFQKITGLNYVVLRPANVYGTRQDASAESGVISIIKDCIDSGKTFRVFGSGAQTRDYVHVSDVVRACMIQLELDMQEVYNVSTGVETSVNELVEMMEKISGKYISCTRKDAIPGELMRSCLNNQALIGDSNGKWDKPLDLKTGLTELLC
jgi:UDP-glucose 4-epimerase